MSNDPKTSAGAGSERKPPFGGQQALQTFGALATTAMAVLTFLTLLELKHANDLVHRSQNVSMRPYLTLSEVRNTFVAPPGTPGERWLVQAIVLNQSDFPARQVRGIAWIDPRGENIERPPSAEMKPGFLSPRGGFLGLQTTISKQEALGLQLENNGELYLHVNAWYHSPDDSVRQLRALCRLSYVEGRTIEWLPIEVTGD